MQLLIEGSVYSIDAKWVGGAYMRVASIRGRPLIKEIRYAYHSLRDGVTLVFGVFEIKKVLADTVTVQPNQHNFHAIHWECELSFHMVKNKLHNDSSTSCWWDGISWLETCWTFSFCFLLNCACWSVYIACSMLTALTSILHPACSKMLPLACTRPENFVYLNVQVNLREGCKKILVKDR